MYKEEFKDGTFTNAIIMIKSYIWPGAYIFYRNGRWFNFYLGYGVKADQQDYYPIAPPIPRSDPVERQKYQQEEAVEKPKEKKPLTPQEKIERLESIINSQEKFNDFLTTIFELIDTDRSGQIDKRETNRFLSEVSKALDMEEPDESEIEEFFKMFDKDKSGYISKEELAEPLKGLILVWHDVMKENLQEQSE